MTDLALAREPATEMPFEDLVARVSRRYPGLDLASIERAVVRAAQQFDRATVLDFLPILIERRVCADLEGSAPHQHLRRA